MLRQLRRAKPVILPLSLLLPPLIATTLFKKQDLREICDNEVVRSRRTLENLLQSQGQHQHHLQNLTDNGGVTLFPKLLRKNEIQIWRSYLKKATIDNRDNVRSNRGRLHSHQESRRDPYHEKFLALIESLPEIKIAVNKYFEYHKITRFKLTQLQFLLAESGSEHQIWHRDNTAPGLTLLIALDDVHSNGPTELLLGSHLDDFKVSSNEYKAMLGCLTAGGAILYDARVIHRGRGFNSSSIREKKVYENRPVLILRWDSLETPPPGAGLIVTNFVDYLGSLRSFAVEAQALYERLLEPKRK